MVTDAPEEILRRRNITKLNKNNLAFPEGEKRLRAQRSTVLCDDRLSIFSSDMASRSPAIFLLLALPLLCYVVSIEAHTLPDDIVPDSRGLSDTVVPESSLDDDEMDEFMQATSRSRLTKGAQECINGRDANDNPCTVGCSGRRLLGSDNGC